MFLDEFLMKFLMTFNDFLMILRDSLTVCWITFWILLLDCLIAWFLDELLTILWQIVDNFLTVFWSTFNKKANKLLENKKASPFSSESSNLPANVKVTNSIPMRKFLRSSCCAINFSNYSLDKLPERMKRKKTKTFRSETDLNPPRSTRLSRTHPG